MPKPLVIDLYCGLGGWTAGFLAEGWEAVGFDIERHHYRIGSYPGQMVLQDVRTLHGAQFWNASCIVASPPCQAYSYMAMPWTRAKAMAAAIRNDYCGERFRRLNELFDACFRIQREASEAAGRWIPMVVENVKGAQPWVGKAKAHFGSFYLWGDIESVDGAITYGGARFGNTLRAARRVQKFNPDGTDHGQGSWFAIADSKNRGSGLKLPGNNSPILWKDREIQRLKDAPTTLQGVADTFGGSKDTPLRNNNSHSSARKEASALIAKIPLELASFVAREFYPRPVEDREGKNLQNKNSA